MPPVTQHRIVSLLPSVTEIVCALGLRACLVGRSHECDFPSDVAQLPVCCDTWINANAPSAIIHQQVSERLTNALSLYRVDMDGIQSLRPTVVLTQTQCDVCAVSEDHVRQAFAERTGLSEIQLVSLAPMQLADLWSDIRQVAKLLNVTERGESLVRELRGRLGSVNQTTSRASSRPRVACIEWMDPLMAAGNWVPELVEAAGGTCVFGKPGQHSPWLSWHDLLAADPEVIVVMPCGFSLARTKEELPTLSQSATWSQLNAVRSKQVFAVDGHHYFNRPGPRLVDSAEILSEILHPRLFVPNKRSTAWEQVG